MAIHLQLVISILVVFFYGLSIAKTLPTVCSDKTSNENVTNIGCYSRNVTSPAKSNQIFPNMTMEPCFAFCFCDGYPYAGLHNRSKCLCWHSLPSAGGNEVGDDKCGLPCHGDISTFCGGLTTVQIYQHSKDESQFEFEKGTRSSTTHVSTNHLTSHVTSPRSHLAIVTIFASFVEATKSPISTPRLAIWLSIIPLLLLSGIVLVVILWKRNCFKKWKLGACRFQENNDNEDRDNGAIFCNSLSHIEKEGELPHDATKPTKKGIVCPAENGSLIDKLKRGFPGPSRGAGEPITYISENSREAYHSKMSVCPEESHLFLPTYVNMSLTDFAAETGRMEFPLHRAHRLNSLTPDWACTRFQRQNLTAELATVNYLIANGRGDRLINM